MNNSSHLSKIFWILSQIAVKGYVLTKIPLDSPSNLETPEHKLWSFRRRDRDHTIIVRKTEEEDLLQIADLLANASIGRQDERNWGTRIEILKARSSFKTQIHQRLKAAEAASKILSNPENCEFLETADERDTCSLLWLEDNFRIKLELAAKTASIYEGTDTLWDNHNFHLQPPDPMMMNHVIMTAVERRDGPVVGFCEIAMLPIPPRNNGERVFAPCIINLVVSPHHRRRGIATRMIQNAERFVGLHWLGALSSCCNTDDEDWKGETILGLYVDRHNDAAISLYLAKKFKIADYGNDYGGQLFLEKDIARNLIYA